MTDENKKTTGDDEYQFPHDEYVTGEQEPSSESHESEHEDHHADASESVADQQVSGTVDGPSKLSGIIGRLSILQNKRVVMVIGAAVVAIIAFKIMTPSHHVKVVKKQATVQAVAPQDSTQDMMLSKLNRLSQDASNSQGTVNQMQSQLSGMRSALNTATSNSVAMKSAVIALAQQVQDLTNQLKAQNAQPHKKYLPAPIITYHLVALVPGRAWIVGSNGESDSVTVGAKLKTYGTVKEINTGTGKVLTTSGKVITYNSEGN